MTTVGSAPVVPTLSLVLPAYREATKLPADLAALTDALVARRADDEIIVVDDGSDDGTRAVVERFASTSGVPVAVVTLERHRGKGAAVRCGVLRATRDIVVTIDVGGCVTPEQILRAADRVASGDADVVVGSRRHPAASVVPPPRPIRRIFSVVFQLFTRLLGVDRALTDTQCGMKAYRASAARAVFLPLLVDGPTFDVEVLLRAADAGLRVVEVPVAWRTDRDTRHPTVGLIVSVAHELALLARWRMRRLVSAR